MATILPEKNIIYLAAPGTASTTLEWIFTGQFKGVYLEAPENLFQYGTRHATPAELCAAQAAGELNYDGEIDFDNTVYITSVRNPYAYHYSEWYRHRTKWVKLLTDQSSWIYQQPQKIEQIVAAVTTDFSTYILDRLGQYVEAGHSSHLNQQFVNSSHYHIRSEFLYEELRQLMGNLGYDQEIKKQDLNITEKSNRDREYWRHYSQEARDCVRRFNLPTIEKFQYEF